MMTRHYFDGTSVISISEPLSLLERSTFTIEHELETSRYSDSGGTTRSVFMSYKRVGTYEAYSNT